jgi:hypothetical protein
LHYDWGKSGRYDFAGLPIMLFPAGFCFFEKNQQNVQYELGFLGFHPKNPNSYHTD